MTPEAKPIWQSKTFWAAVLTIGVGIGGLIAQYLQTGDYSPTALTLVAVGAMNIVLRYISDTPIK